MDPFQQVRSPDVHRGFQPDACFSREPQTYCAEDERIHIHATELSSEPLLPACAAATAESKQWQRGSLFLNSIELPTSQTC